MADPITELLSLAGQLPECLHSDWDGTNHYELTDREPGKDFWWMDINAMLADEYSEGMLCEDEEGKRLGLVMDVAVAARRAVKDVEALRAERDRLRAMLRRVLDDAPPSIGLEYHVEREDWYRVREEAEQLLEGHSDAR